MKKNTRLIRVDSEFYDYLVQRQESMKKNLGDVSVPQMTRLITVQLKEMKKNKKGKGENSIDMSYLKW